MRTKHQVLSCLVGLVWLGLTSRPSLGQGQLLLHGKDLMGFRTRHTELWWDNFVVTRL
jgi:hypothetical protein